ncbi:mucin-3A [Centroberyx affinis]|uniref:mucin-3A n=1 Tax=Centroberyx affinis TaxID=166261 RepID=UPI003A5C74AC
MTSSTAGTGSDVTTADVLSRSPQTSSAFHKTFSTTQESTLFTTDVTKSTNVFSIPRNIFYNTGVYIIHNRCHQEEPHTNAPTVTNESVTSSPSSTPTSVTQTYSETTQDTLPTARSPNVSCTAEDCHCNGAPCSFNVTLGKCQCHCQGFTYGDTCSYGHNETTAVVDSDAIPTRKANISLEIMKTFEDAFNNLSSPQSQEFIRTLTTELSALCKEVDPQNFKNVQVIELRPGSVVAESVAEYNYTNNETQIQIINTKLGGILTGILNDTRNLKRIAQAFGNVSVQLNGVILQPTDIKNITDLQPFINCSQFADYTAELTDGRWQCVGPCKTNPDYCHQHGECQNDILIGPTCRCYESSLEQYYGQQCDFFHWGPGFYGALFGSLAAALLLIIAVIAVIMAKRRHMSIWSEPNVQRLYSNPR